MSCDGRSGGCDFTHPHTAALAMRGPEAAPEVSRFGGPETLLPGAGSGRIGGAGSVGSHELPVDPSPSARGSCSSGDLTPSSCGPKPACPRPLLLGGAPLRRRRGALRAVGVFAAGGSLGIPISLAYPVFLLSSVGNPSIYIYRYMYTHTYIYIYMYTDINIDIDIDMYIYI